MTFEVCTSSLGDCTHTERRLTVSGLSTCVSGNIAACTTLEDLCLLSVLRVVVVKGWTACKSPDALTLSEQK